MSKRTCLGGRLSVDMGGGKKADVVERADFWDGVALILEGTRNADDRHVLQIFLMGLFSALETPGEPISELLEQVISELYDQPALTP